MSDRITRESLALSKKTSDELKGIEWDAFVRLERAVGMSEEADAEAFVVRVQQARLEAIRRERKMRPVMTFFGPFTTGHPDNTGEEIVQAGLEWRGEPYVTIGPGPIMSPRDAIAVAMITQDALADGTPATFCKFDVQRHHVPTLLAQDLVPTICGVVLQRDIENKRVVKSMVMSIALVPRKQSTDPHCDMWPLDSNGNRFDTLVRKSVAH